MLDRIPHALPRTLRFGAAAFVALLLCNGARAAAPAGRYALDAETVIDKSTGLTWQRVPADSGYSWADAARYCTTLSLGGGLGWRLPSVKELETLVDEGQANPSIDLDAFPDTPNEFFWTSSSVAQFPQYAWAVGFSMGSANFFFTSSLQWVRCVR